MCIETPEDKESYLIVLEATKIIGQSPQLRRDTASSFAGTIFGTDLRRLAQVRITHGPARAPGAIFCLRTCDAGVRFRVDVVWRSTPSSIAMLASGASPADRQTSPFQLADSGSNRVCCSRAAEGRRGIPPRVWPILANVWRAITSADPWSADKRRTEFANRGVDA